MNSWYPILKQLLKLHSNKQCLSSGTANISTVNASSLESEWKAEVAVWDDDLVQKLWTFEENPWGCHFIRWQERSSFGEFFTSNSILSALQTVTRVTRLVMCWLGLAWKPQLGLSISRPRPLESEAWALTVGLGRLRPWLMEVRNVERVSYLLLD